MRRRKVLALVGSTGIATIAGCSGGNSGSGGDGDGSTNTSNGSNGASSGSCVPATDSLSSLLPQNSDQFSQTTEVSSGLSIGTDTYVVARYETSDGATVDMLIAEYSSSDAAASNEAAVRSQSENEVMGTLVSENYVIGVDAPSQQVARALVRASEVSCADQLSFSGGGGNSTATEESFNLGEVIWSQGGGDAARSNAVDVEGLTASEPSQYTVEISVEAGDTVKPLVFQNALVTGSQVHQIDGGSVVAELPVSSIKSPVYHNKTIVTVTEDGKIRGIDAQSRDEKWNYLPRDSVVSLAAGGGFVFAVVGSVTVVAIDIQSGEKVWERQGETLHGVTNGKLFVGGAGNLAVNISDGSVAYEVGNDIKRVSSDGSVYVGNIAKLNAEDGSEIWNSSGLDEVIAADDEFLYGRPDGIGANFTAVNASNGEQAWSKELETRSVAVGSNRVYTSSNSRIFTLSKDTGEEQARYAVGGRDGLRVGVGALVAIGGNTATVLTE